MDFMVKQSKHKVNKRKQKELLFMIAFLFIPFLQFIIFYVGVNFNSILLSFKKYDLETGLYSFYGFQNFVDVINDIFLNKKLMGIAINSLEVYFWNTFVGMPLNLVFAYIVYKKVPMSKFFQVVLFLPSILSSVVMSMMFSHFVNRALPQLANILFGVKEFPNLMFETKTAFPMQIFYCLWSGFGVSLILYSGAMSRIPESIIEYGQLEGIGLFREFTCVVLPLIADTISVFLVTGIAGIFINQMALYNFFGEGARSDLQTLGYYFYIQVIGENASYADYPYASAAGLIFSLVASPLTLFVKYLLEKISPSAEF